ncbi:hypothetical protein, partial [Belliella pelovolcani]|uniref:hypothetical protein n=1 Tax=Belliella pelovolcani TaxID=529505 RepID=UPI00391ABC13
MNNKLKIATGLFSIGLLATLIYKLTEVPGVMFLSGLFLGGMVVALILVGGLILTLLTKLIFKRLPFWIVFMIFMVGYYIKLNFLAIFPELPFDQRIFAAPILSKETLMSAY